MLSSRDKKAVQFAAEHPRLSRWCLWLLPLMFLVFSVGQLYVADQLAKPAGLSMSEVFGLWFAGLDPTGSYAGITASAVLRVERAFGMFCLALLSAGIAFTGSIWLGRMLRMGAEIAKHEGTATNA